MNFTGLFQSSKAYPGLLWPLRLPGWPPDGCLSMMHRTLGRCLSGTTTVSPTWQATRQTRHFSGALASLLEAELLPEARGSHDPSLALYPDSPAWLEALERRLEAYHPLRLFRSQHRFDRQAFEKHARFLEPLPTEYRQLPIDAGLCEQFRELAFAYQLLWGGTQGFLAHGFGFCMLADGELASACDSAFCAGGWAEMGVETREAYRRQGLARQVTTAFIHESLRRGLEPVWECWWENEPSRKLATRLGFTWLEDYPVLFIDLAS
jgi:RimJ/RimL family protein N-acetyltransferase